MTKTKREKLVEAILLYCDHSNPITQQFLTRVAMASEEELIDILVRQVNVRHRPLRRYNPL
jgi:hypothetical protein